MIESVFIFTAGVVFTGLLMFIGAIFGNHFTAPVILWWNKWTVGPTHFLLWYPSLMFQFYFWADKLGVFVS